MKVVITRRAQGDLDALLNYLLAKNPSAAKGQLDLIAAAIVSLESLPSRGRLGEVAGTREIVVRRTAHIIVYRIVEEEVQIVHIRHRSQDWPADTN